MTPECITFLDKVIILKTLRLNIARISVCCGLFVPSFVESRVHFSSILRDFVSYVLSR